MFNLKWSFPNCFKVGSVLPSKCDVLWINVVKPSLSEIWLKWNHWIFENKPLFLFDRF